jgi:hypothetical protein
MILYSEGATKTQEDEAEMILGVLTQIYPGHPWAVRVYDGGFFIRHLAFPHNWGMNFHYRDVSHDAAVLKKQIILKAGEWLERANMKRGRYDADQETERVEGVPEKFQPHQSLPDDVNLVMGEAPLRIAPRPQALKDVNK